MGQTIQLIHTSRSLPRNSQVTSLFPVVGAILYPSSYSSGIVIVVVTGEGTLNGQVAFPSLVWGQQMKRYFMDCQCSSRFCTERSGNQQVYHSLLLLLLGVGKTHKHIPLALKRGQALK